MHRRNRCSRTRNAKRAGASVICGCARVCMCVVHAGRVRTGGYIYIRTWNNEPTEKGITWEAAWRDPFSHYRDSPLSFLIFRNATRTYAISYYSFSPPAATHISIPLFFLCVKIYNSATAEYKNGNDSIATGTVRIFNNLIFNIVTLESRSSYTDVSRRIPGDSRNATLTPRH